LEKLAKGQFFGNNFFVMRFFLFCLRIWNQRKILLFLVPILTYLKKKVFSSIFGKNIKWSILLFSVVLPRSGGGEGDATFLLKCHALCPICLTFLVVYFYTHIYVSILNLCAAVSAGAILCLLGLSVFIYRHYKVNSYYF